MSLKLRTFTKEFKQQILHEAQAGKSIAQAARGAFRGNGHAYTRASKIAEFERLIG